MTASPPEIQEFISCDCNTDGLFLSHMSDDDNGFVYVSMWVDAPGQINWRHRLRHIWHIIRYGDPYSDQVVLDRKSVERLRHFCDCAIAEGVYDRPWMSTLRSGESVTTNSAEIAMPTVCVKCPVCCGAGRLPYADSASSACDASMTCHGCGGRGWVTP